MGFPGRLKRLIKATGLKRDQFAEKSGKSRNQIFKYLGGDNLPTADFFEAIKKEFPWANIEWLITGVGEMESRSAGVHQTANADGAVQVGGGIKVSGDAANFVIGGSHRKKTSKEMSVSYGNGLVRIEKVVRVLEDYVAPKMIEEIKERLSN